MQMIYCLRSCCNLRNCKDSSTAKIIESKLVWKYTENDEIRLAWWMQFTDPNLSLGKSLPGLVCIDANTGEVLLASYEIG
jgi:hypothetical protein